MYNHPPIHASLHTSNPGDDSTHTAAAAAHGWWAIVLQPPGEGECLREGRDHVGIGAAPEVQGVCVYL